MITDTQGPKSISPGELNRLIASGGPVELLDVRTPGEFESVHVPGARLVPLDELDAGAFLKQRGQADQPVYVLCQSGGRARKAIEKLRQAGFGGGVLVEGGTQAWIDAGLPVNRGAAKVISLERQVRIAAGSLVLTGVLLAYFVHPGFIGLSAFVGAGLVFAGVTDWCGMGLLLAKMPWNQKSACDSGSCCQTKN
jgi:rhodanese-related sulfurtransferase